MAEYILRNEAIAELRHRCYPCGEGIEAINSIPAADVVPVVHGRWVDGKCSNCGVDIPTDDSHDAIFENECHFCYYCGAKMDGGVDDEAD